MFCIDTGEVTVGGRRGTNSQGVVHGKGGINNVVQRFVGLMLAGGNTSWERMSGSEMTAAMRAFFYC